MSGAIPPVHLRLHGVDREDFYVVYLGSPKSGIFITILDVTVSKYLCSVSRHFLCFSWNPLNESNQKCFYTLDHVNIMSVRLYGQRGLP